MDHLAGKPPGRVNGEEGVIAQHPHVQVHTDIRNQCADRAEPDDAERFAQQFRTCEVRLFFFHQFRDFLAFPGNGLDPCNAAEDVTGCHHKSADLLFLDRLRVGAGRVKHHDSLFGTAVDRNVVVSGPCARNGKEALREVHVVQVGAAQQETARMPDVLANLAADFFQRIDSRCGYFVHGLYLKHASAQTPSWFSQVPLRLPAAWRYTATPACRPQFYVPSDSQALSGLQRR